MIDREANADALADGVIVVRWHERERLRAAGQRKRVEEITAAKKLTFNDGLHRAFVVMHQVVRSNQYVNVAAVGALRASGGVAIRRYFSVQYAKLNFHLCVAEHGAGQKNALTNEVGHETVCRPVVEVVRRVPLRDRAVSHYAHAIRHRERFVLVVGDDHGRHALTLKNAAHLNGEAFAQLDVQT